MAEASDDADVGLVCSLCLEQFVNPKNFLIVVIAFVNLALLPI